MACTEDDDRCSIFSRHCSLRDFIKEVMDAADSSNTEPREIIRQYLSNIQLDILIIRLSGYIYGG